MNDIVRWIRDAALAAHYAHERGVIHRDFKPPNLMIDTEGRVFVMDFGLAKLSTAAAGSGTISGVILGTPAFMSPEQASGRPSEVDRRSDVYSLGSTLYVLLSGQKPFDGETVTDILVRILTTEARPLHQVCPTVPAELEAIIERSMRRVKGERYATAKEFADELSRFLAGEPVQARPATISRRMARKATKHRALLIGAAAAAIALAAGVYFARPSAVPPPPPPIDRLAEWSKLFVSLQDVLSAERFSAGEAAVLLARARREFPEQKKAVDTFIENQDRLVISALAALPRSRWRDPGERSRVERYRAWLAFGHRPTAEAERILAYRGTCTLEILVDPPAEIRGPLVASLDAERRQTPTALRDFEIADGELELVRPSYGSCVVRLKALEDGKTYVIEGAWKDKDTLEVKGGP